jgi:hypothetical protein
VLRPQHLEEKFRVGTWANIPIYGISKTAEGRYEYAHGTELHMIWDVDQVHYAYWDGDQGQMCIGRDVGTSDREIYPKPETRNPQPETRNPKPYIRVWWHIECRRTCF